MKGVRDGQTTHFLCKLEKKKQIEVFVVRTAKVGRPLVSQTCVCTSTEMKNDRGFSFLQIRTAGGPSEAVLRAGAGRRSFTRAMTREVTPSVHAFVFSVF